MEDKNYKELVNFIGEHFDLADKRFDSLEFRFDDLKKDFRQLQTAVDAYATQANTYFMEMAALGSKLDRHERWINIIADRLGLKLPS